MQVYLDGPYGAPAIDLHGGGYKCFLLLSRGMGWAALRAWKRQLLQDALRARGVRAVQSFAVVDHTRRDLLAEFQGWEGGLAGQSLPADLRLVVRSFATAHYRSAAATTRTHCAR